MSAADAEGATLVASCPAKVNLSLQVLGKRDDGFHELDTVFQAIDLWDRLHVRPSDRLTLSCNRPEIPVDGSNLVLRAAEALAGEFGIRPRGELRLHKRIPSEAGLGGGSSDAAAALLLCARFWGLAPEEGALRALAARVGADVPFFLIGGTAHGVGRGDRVTAIESLPETPLLLGCPPYGCSTVKVFGALGPQLTLPRNGVNFPAGFAHKWWTDKDFALAQNDLETVVFSEWPELKAFRDALLDAGATRALLSGSGSTVFGAFPETDSNEGSTRGPGPGSLGDLRDRLAARFEGWSVIETRTTTSGIRIEADLSAG